MTMNKNEWHFDKVIDEIFKPKHFILNMGETGGGKTNMVQRAMEIKQKQGWLAITNTKFKIYESIDGTIKARRIEPEDNVPIKSLNTFSAIFEEICKNKEKKGLRAPVIVETDEFASYFTKFDYWKPMQKNFLQLVGLMRKIDVCWVGTTALDDMIPKELTRKKAGYCDFRLKKDPFMVTKMLEPRTRNIRRIRRILKRIHSEVDSSGVDYEIDVLRRTVHIDDLRHRSLNNPFYVPGDFTYKPIPQGGIAKAGTITFSEHSAAMLKLGYRKDGSAFDLGVLIDIMSDEIEEDIPQKILSYIDGDSYGEEQYRKIPDDQLFYDLIRRLKGKKRFGKGEIFNLVDLAEDFGQKRAYQVIQQARKKLGYA